MYYVFTVCMYIRIYIYIYTQSPPKILEQHVKFPRFSYSLKTFGLRSKDSHDTGVLNVWFYFLVFKRRCVKQLRILFVLQHRILGEQK